MLITVRLQFRHDADDADDADDATISNPMQDKCVWLNPEKFNYDAIVSKIVEIEDAAVQEQRAIICRDDDSGLYFRGKVVAMHNNQDAYVSNTDNSSISFFLV